MKIVEGTDHQLTFGDLAVGQTFKLDDQKRACLYMKVFPNIETITFSDLSQRKFNCISLDDASCFFVNKDSNVFRVDEYECVRKH